MLYPTVDWPSLRVWTDVDGVETIYYVPLLANAVAMGNYTPATATFTLAGSVTSADYIELAWLDQHFNYQLTTGDTLSSAVAALAAIIAANQATGLVSATASGTTITLTYLGMPGSNGDRIGVYGTVHGAGTETWTPEFVLFSEGVSPSTWQVTLNFGNLLGSAGAAGGRLVTVPTANVRKLRWTWAADWQPSNFARREFSVTITNWSITGTNLQYSVAGPGSRRIEDDGALSYVGTWSETRGNYSGGSIHSATQPGASVTCSYSLGSAHTLYLGLRCLDGGAPITVQVDAGTPFTVRTQLAGEDVLMRVPIGAMASGQHVVAATHAGAAGQAFWLDFVELAVPSTSLPTFAPTPKTTLATDWDTLHSFRRCPRSGRRG